IAYDIVFSEPDRTSPSATAERLLGNAETAQLVAELTALPDHDEEFARSIESSPVVLGFFLNLAEGGREIDPVSGVALSGSLPDRSVLEYRGATQSLPQFVEVASGIGSLSHPGDEDGILRRIPLLAIHDGQLLPSLSLEAVRVATDGGSIIVRASDGSGETASSPGAVAGVRIGAREMPVGDDGRLWIYPTEPASERVIPIWQILQGEISADELEREFAGKIVFIGASAPGLRDLVPTPLGDNIPGVTLHAQAAEQMMLGEYLVRPDWARGMEFFLILLLGGGLALLLPRIGASSGAGVGSLGIVLVMGTSWIAYSNDKYLLDPTYPALAIILVYTVQTLLGFYREEKQRAYIHDAFDRYLSPELVNQIADDPGKLELGGEERNMSVLMCDVRQFSRISEKYSPKEVIDFLIEFLTPMSEILLAQKATLDKYIGDAILAFWNAPLDDPDHQRNAACAALAMHEKLEELNRSMPDKEGATWPGQVRIGIGLNSGICCVGNMGSRQRLDYSLIGDTVNLAARLEGQTKHYGVPIIIGSGTARALDGFALLELDRIRVVGRDRPETIFALLGDPDFARLEEAYTLAEGHGRVLAAFRSADWNEVEGLLEELSDQYVALGLDKLNVLFRNRVAQLRENPPDPGWDGVYEATEK
ncbi:MAG TPA: adenylate/guanylate cyclase domain-containing protein, partial [Erythrobacter sp.]|nr:adenylate/guanylate cyclase domain-containing protein [Erythrobacter sp.]